MSYVIGAITLYGALYRVSSVEGVGAGCLIIVFLKWLLHNSSGVTLKTSTLDNCKEAHHRDMD